ncbi:hypothetical protein GE061_013763 [Apolygus lucorum]|uniref:Peptidase S1 domain-containing protein n=1 Tax=Apolygus lucorum TaxID=248454 RepID=A0A8S9XRG3_APOLU|nr:hypothetical protein GE061_013763 [Apolygus lucorum]
MMTRNHDEEECHRSNNKRRKVVERLKEMVECLQECDRYGKVGEDETYPPDWAVPLITYPLTKERRGSFDKDVMKTPPWEKDRKSVQVIGGLVVQGCQCTKRNGLQADCKMTGCNGHELCLTKPYPLCPNGGHANQLVTPEQAARIMANVPGPEPTDAADLGKDRIMIQIDQGWQPCRDQAEQPTRLLWKLANLDQTGGAVLPKAMVATNHWSLTSLKKAFIIRKDLRFLHPSCVVFDDDGSFEILEESLLRVYGGDRDPDKADSDVNGQIIGVASAEPHPDYKPEPVVEPVYDFCILKTLKKFALGPELHTTPLYSTDVSEVQKLLGTIGTKCKTMAWGFYEDGYRQNEQIKGVWMEVIFHGIGRCDRVRNDGTARMNQTFLVEEEGEDDSLMCAVSSGGSHICLMDPGSPILCNEKIIAIVSNIGLLCEGGYEYVVTTGINNAMAFITESPSFDGEVANVEDRIRDRRLHPISSIPFAREDRSFNLI